MNQQDLVNFLNERTKEYDEGNPTISDKEWDDLYFELVEKERQSGQALEDSPTQTIKYEVQTELRKVEHNHVMASLDKTKDIKAIKKFLEGKAAIGMAKCDGLTLTLQYEDGELVDTQTRGDSRIGESVFIAAKTIPSIPKTIAAKGSITIDGEIVCLLSDFESFANEYKNPRNFAAGSIRLLDPNEVAKRKLTFVAWDVIGGPIETLTEKLEWLRGLGFKPVPYFPIKKAETINKTNIDAMVAACKEIGLPIDGLVFKYDNCALYSSLGMTSHHPKGALAFKLYDEEYPTTLIDIEFTLGRTGRLTPTAVFEPVEIDAVVKKASLHNLSVMYEVLGTPKVGQKIWVAKMNQIIPQITRADKDSGNEPIPIPEVCPVCGQPTFQVETDNALILMCKNKQCEGQLLYKLTHWCARDYMDIRGLSEATLEDLIEWGWVSKLTDLYSLDKFVHEWNRKPGYGVVSVRKILEAIENSKKDCDLAKFIAAAGIPNVGSGTAKDIVRQLKISTFDEFISFVEDDKFDFASLENIGYITSESIKKFNCEELKEISQICSFKAQQLAANPSKVLTFCITGRLEEFKNRNELVAAIEAAGHKVSSAVSSKTDYLINNDKTSESAKNVKAKQLNIPIISEKDFLEII